MNMN